MKMKRMISSMLILGVIALGMSACEKNNTQPDNTLVITDSVVTPFNTDHFTFYSLKTGEVVPFSDSATTKWDIGLKFTSIILNSHASGPGEAGVIVKTDGKYDTFSMAPATGYAYDTLLTDAGGNTSIKYAINATFGSPDSWYVYDPTNHLVSSKAGYYFVIRTADGKFAKLEVPYITYADYTEGAMFPNELVFKLNYVYQPDGTGNLLK